MENSTVWSAFEEVFCLTLEGDVERQRHASKELDRVGLRGFRFLEGVAADSAEVQEAFDSGLVHTFPTCFRCGQIQCGRTDCNNTLIKPQVGCFLSFIKLFRLAVASRSNTFLLVEDDVRFPDYAEDLARAALNPEQLRRQGFFDDEPCLISMGRGKAPGDVWRFDGAFQFIPGRKLPQNPCFAFNKAFARLAIDRFVKIAHTSDVYIHFQISEFARHYSLEPTLAYELSTSTGALPSRIHPKAAAFENEENLPETRQRARAAFERHLKHTLCIPLAVVGSPGCGTGTVARLLERHGLDVGHETIRPDGISSWAFAVFDTDLPFGQDLYAANSSFVYPRQYLAVISDPQRAVPILILENSKNIQSYAFRRRWILKTFGIDIDRFSSGFERALASYVYWYRLVLARKPVAWIRLEDAEQDLAAVFSSGLLTAKPAPEREPAVERDEGGKPYMGVEYPVPYIPFVERLAASDRFLQDEYWKFQCEIPGVFLKV